MQQPLKMLLCMIIACLGIAQAEMLTTDISTRGSDEAFSNVSNAWLFPSGAAVLNGTAIEIPAGEENLWVSQSRAGSRDRDAGEKEEDGSGVSQLMMLASAGGSVSESAVWMLASLSSGRGEERRAAVRSGSHRLKAEDEDGSRRFAALSDDDRAAAEDVRPASRPFEVVETPSRPTAPMFSAHDEEAAPSGNDAAEAANTPEPSAIVLIALGLALIGARKLRRA